MCASAKNVIIPTPPCSCVACHMCASAKNVITPTHHPTTPAQQLRSMSHVCKCKVRQYPQPTPPCSCVACHMCASAKKVLSPPPTPEKSLCFLVYNAPGLHFDCKFTSHSRRPRRNRCVFSCKMRVAFILTVNILCHSCQPRRNRCVFSCKMRLGFILSVNLFATDHRPRPTCVFFNENVRCTNPPDSLCFLRSNASCVQRSCKFK